MAFATTQDAVLTAICNALAARTYIVDHGITVYSAMQKDWHDTVMLDTTTLTQAYAAIGGHRAEERYTIDGIAGARRSGAGEEVARAARTAATAIVNELNAMLAADPTLGGLVHMAQLSACSIASQGATDTPARLCVYSLTISIHAYLTRT